MNDEMQKLYIEPTSKCNFNCKMCFRNSWIDEKPCHMTREVFDAVIDGMPKSVHTVFFGGMGEPLYHPDIVYMVKKAAKTWHKVELLTNGSLLTEEMSDALLEAGLDKLWVSLDSLTSDGYGNIRVGGNLKGVEENIAAFNRARGRVLRKTHLCFAFVAMKSNIKDLPLVAEYAVKCRASEVNISNMLPSTEDALDEILYRRILEQELGNPAIKAKGPLFKMPMMDVGIKEAGEAKCALERMSDRIEYAGVLPSRNIRKCPFIEEGRCYVRSDGGVAPCMGLLHSAYTYLLDERRIMWKHVFGNAGDMPLKDIWESREFSEFRDRVRRFDFSPCARCGGCDRRRENQEDCFNNPAPTCGACLWAEGIVSCP